MFTVFTEIVHHLFTEVQFLITSNVHRVVHRIVHLVFTDIINFVHRMFIYVHRIDHWVNVHYLITNVHLKFTCHVHRVVHPLLYLRILASKIFPERLEFWPMVLFYMIDMAEPQNLFLVRAILADDSDVLPAFLNLLHLFIVYHVVHYD